MQIKVEFICTKCGKQIQAQKDIYDKAYKGQYYCLSCQQITKK